MCMYIYIYSYIVIYNVCWASNAVDYDIYSKIENDIKCLTLAAPEKQSLSSSHKRCATQDGK